MVQIVDRNAPKSAGLSENHKREYVLFGLHCFIAGRTLGL